MWTKLFRKMSHGTVTPPATNVRDFLAAIAVIAPPAGGGAYAFQMPDTGCHGFVQFIVCSPTQATIHRLWTLDPGKGIGSYVLDKVCELADLHGVELNLKALPIGRKPFPLSRDNLKAWYQRHGFKTDRKKMVREPRKLVGVAPGTEMRLAITPSRDIDNQDANNAAALLIDNSNAAIHG